MLTAQDVKEKYPVTFVLESIIGLHPVSSKGRWKRYQYGDGRPALVAADDVGVIIDHHGLPISPWGEPKTDCIGIVQTHFGVDFLEAMRIITGEDFSTDFKLEKPAVPKMADKPKYPLHLIMKWAKDLQSKRKDYLIERRITPEYAWKIKLGYRFKEEQGSVEIADGKWFPVQSGWRFVIPTMRTKPIYELKRVSQRLDTDLAKKSFHTMSDKAQKSLVERMGSEDKVIDMLWRSKYIQRGPSIETFQEWQVKAWDGKKFDYPAGEVLFVSEGEFNAINLHEFTGQASIATKKAVVHNMNEVVIVRDNDDAGEEIAENTRQQFSITGVPIKVLRPFDGFNDVNDMAKADVLPQWLAENNLPRKEVRFGA